MMHQNSWLLLALLLAVVCTGSVRGQLAACATTVPVVSGYLYFPFLDTDPPSESIDLHDAAAAAEADSASYLEAQFMACNATEDCVALNTVLYGKSASQLALPLRTYDAQDPDCSSIWIKSDFIGRPFTAAEQEACKEAGNTAAVYGQYTFIPLKDSASPKGTRVTPIVPTQRAALLAACDADDKCVAINTNGYLKEELAAAPVSVGADDWITGACGGIYIKTSAAPAAYLAAPQEQSPAPVALPSPQPSPRRDCVAGADGCCSGEVNCDRYRTSPGDPPPGCKCSPYDPARAERGIPRCAGPICACIRAPGTPNCADFCRGGC